MTLSVLVTGGAGFIGSHLVDQLSDCRVRVLDNLTTGKEANLAGANCEFVRGDILDRTLVAELMRDADVVFHLACRGVRHSIGNPVESHLVNAEGTLRLLVEAHRAGVARFVHVSSSEVYGTARYAPMDEQHPTFPETVYGAAIFTETGCSGCHVPALPDASGGELRPYSDFLLHDMGEGLADGRPEVLAGGGEWRTAPLWGMGDRRSGPQATYLHDGRARSPLEAILWHGGEAMQMRDAVVSMDPGDRAALLRFLETL